MVPTTRPTLHRPKGLRGGVIIGLSLALAGAAVGTATGAVTPFQQVIVRNTAAEPVPVTGTINVGNTPANQNVTVSNFPATQPVSGTVNVGNLPGALVATKRVTVDISATALDSHFVPIQPMNVTSVIVADGDEDNFGIDIGGFTLMVDHEGNYSEHFPAAFGASNGFFLNCENAVLNCDVTVTILGF